MATTSNQGAAPPAPRNDAPAALTSAARAAAFRRRKRDKLRVLRIELRQEEIDVMVAQGLLKMDERDIQFAIMAALYAVLDRAFPALAAGRLPKVPG
jgi:hypothetical protein